MTIAELFKHLHQLDNKRLDPQAYFTFSKNLNTDAAGYQSELTPSQADRNRLREERMR